MLTTRRVAQCVWGPSQCLCHTVAPCFNDEAKGEQCYFAWIGSGGMGLTVYDGGKKFKTDFCGLSCGEYEKTST